MKSTTITATNYEEIGKCKIILKNAKKNISYPMVRFPSKYIHLVGKQAKIYRIDNASYLIVIQEDDGLYNHSKKLHNSKSIFPKKLNLINCKENLRTTIKPEGMPRAGIEPATFRSSGNPFLTKKGVSSPKKTGSGKCLDYSEHREEFIFWIEDKNFSKRYAKDIIIYLDKYLLGNIVCSPADIAEVRRSSSSKAEITIALRVFLNYCEEMDIIDEGFITKLRKPLKVVRSKPDNYVPNDDKVKEAYRKINPKYRIVFKIFSFGGIRITESALFFSNYNRERVVINGKVARYPLFAIRKSKRAYFVYFPSSMINEMKRIKLTDKAISTAFIKSGLPAKYLRKWNYNFLIMHNVPESVADFIQGRSPVSIGSMHYLAKVKQADYWYAQVADKLMKIFE
jgi:intergrase/recombinase